MSFLIAAALTFVVGVAAFVHGGADDSPGLQLIGLVLVVVASVICVRTVRRTRTG